MAQPLRVEDPNRIFLITSRTIGSRLWFVNNPGLERAINSYLARYQELYEVEIFGWKLMGNHYHLVARFPKCNKADFMRAFNGIVARLTAAYVPSHDGGRLWGRRYSEQVLPEEADVTHWAYYCALNEVLSGLVSHPNQDTCYNSFYDSAIGIEREYTVFERMAYNEALRRGEEPDKEAYIKRYKLRFSRLPEFADLSPDEYRKRLLHLLKERLAEAHAERRAQGKWYPSRKTVKSIVPGARPKRTKKSHRYSLRPLVLTLSREARNAFLSMYFFIREQFIEASKLFRSGNRLVEFPTGTYPPQLAPALVGV